MKPSPLDGMMRQWHAAPTAVPRSGMYCAEHLRRAFLKPRLAELLSCADCGVGQVAAACVSEDGRLAFRCASCWPKWLMEMERSGS